jgi:cytochrome d ubiquinol oxidase subunit I
MLQEQTRYALSVPNLGSLILTHSLTGQYPGLKDFRPEDRPNATVVFWTFRVMAGLGLLMIALGLAGIALRLRLRLYRTRAFLKFALLMGPAGIVALLAGWYTTEIGRQPWLIYGLMRTAEGVSAHHSAQVGFTLGVFVVVYLAVFGAGSVYGLRLMAGDPARAPHPAGGPGHRRQPMRPLSAAVPERADTASRIPGQS